MSHIPNPMSHSWLLPRPLSLDRYPLPAALKPRARPRYSLPRRQGREGSVTFTPTPAHNPNRIALALQPLPRLRLLRFYVSRDR